MCDFIKGAKKNVQKLIPYEPGKPIEDVARELGLKVSGIVKLASNENPLGASSDVLNVLDQAKETLFRYPDGNALEAKFALSQHVDVDVSQITLGCGSDELLRLIAMGYAGDGDEVLYSEYGFAVYPIAALSVGAVPVAAPSKDWGHDLDAMFQCISEKTRIIYIANPNNPTGTFLPRSDVLAFLDRVPEHILVVLDEAYTEYLEGVSPCESPSWIKQYPNLIVTRTFSKAYGLAGLRVGYAIAHPDVTDILNRVRPAFNVGIIPQKAAIAALGDQDFVKRSRELNNQNLQQVQEKLQALGFDTIPSKGNFITFDSRQDGRAVFQRLLAEGVIVRPLTGYGMPQHLRVSIGLPEDNAVFLQALKKIMSR